jgi:hypothetical protein
MSARPFFSGRIPQSLHDALEEYRQQTNESKTEILIKALSTYIEHSIETPTSYGGAEASRIEVLEKKFEVLKQEMCALREMLVTPSNSPALEHRKEETVEQISLILKENVIKDDNDIDNESVSEKTNGKSDDNSIDNKLDNDEGNSPRRVLIGTMKTAEVLNLPGLQGKDLKKIKNKVGNAKQLKDRTARIDPYTIVLSERPLVEGRQRQELFWDVYEDKDESVIGSDNNNDNQSRSS